MASGRPVIAYKKGGAMDYIKENVNGLFFDNQSPESLNTKILEFENKYEEFDSKSIRDSVEKFDKDYFYKRIKNEISKLLN